MTIIPGRGAALRALLGVLLASLSLPGSMEAAAQAGTKPPSSTELRGSGRPEKRSSALGDLGSNREPIKIDSDRLDVFDKEGRAVFTGNVVAVQGDSTMRCTTMTVIYESARAGGKGGGSPSAATSPLAGGDSAIRKIDCRGPVTIASKTQVATGDNAEFDRAANKVFLIGNAALSDGPNVTRGERVSYDLNTGIANVVGGRVKALIVPSSQNKTGDKPNPARPR